MTMPWRRHWMLRHSREIHDGLKQRLVLARPGDDAQAERTIFQCGDWKACCRQARMTGNRSQGERLFIEAPGRLVAQETQRCDRGSSRQQQQGSRWQERPQARGRLRTPQAPSRYGRRIETAHAVKARLNGQPEAWLAVEEAG